MIQTHIVKLRKVSCHSFIQSTLATDMTTHIVQSGSDCLQIHQRQRARTQQSENNWHSSTPQVPEKYFSLHVIKTFYKSRCTSFRSRCSRYLELGVETRGTDAITRFKGKLETESTQY